MKKFGYLFLALLALLVIPFSVFAEGEEEETTEVDTRVNIYFFRGEGCSHCAEAEAWFESIQDEYGSKINIIDYETWYSEENSELMAKVAKVRGEEETATGVPYIIIGDQSWIGFDEAYESEMLSKVDQLYEQEVSERYDTMELVHAMDLDDEEKSTVGRDILSLVLIILVVGGCGYGIYVSRKRNA